MALTYQQITRNALLKIGVLDEHQAPSAVQVQDGIRLLNEMLREWEGAGGIELGFFPGTASSDSVSIPDWSERAVTMDLGVRFASDYHVELGSAFIADQKSAHERLLAATMGDIDASLSHVPQGQTKLRRGGDKAAF